MSYFAVALLCLLTAEALMTFGYGFPHAALRAPDTLILVHVVAIGWLSLLMCGALFQFLPVLVVQPLYSNMLPLPTLVSLIAGLTALILGFLQLGGRIAPAPYFFALAGALLSFGFILVLWNLARTLWSAQTRPLPAQFVIVGLISVAATAALGLIFSLAFAGRATHGALLALTGSALPLHVVAGFGGWLTFTAMGVSYRLLAMFMLAPELERRSSKAALYLGAVALTIAIAGGTLAILVRGDVALVLAAAGVLGLMALALYGADVSYLYRARKRPKIELNSRISLFAFAGLAASVVLILILLALGRLTDHLGAVVFLIAFGWLSGFGLAQLYKIVAFLTWLECYGPVLGKTRTPRVQDLVVEARAIKWFRLYFLGVVAGVIALIAGHSLIFQASAAAMLIATGGIVVQLVRTRRLADVEAALRLPQGARRPRLLFSPSQQA
ncbi:MAG TPA: hypothetical protein VK025_14105 [Steroidobacter sp.]|nr:hypothetical protein [Steroidobacteraceae bacterium]HLS82528.1 hypothetical protein [Steroidobacter sp.]